MGKELKNVSIFHTGKHTGKGKDGKPVTKVWTKEHLDHAVAELNETINEYKPAATVEHPPKDKPWPRFGDLDFAEVRHAPTKKNPDRYAIFADFSVADVLYDWVKGGSFPNRSTGFRADGTIHHVAFLGANPPALKGMEEIEFASDDDDVIVYSEAEDSEVEHGDSRMPIVGRVLQGLRELLFRDGKTTEEVDAVIPPDSLERLSGEDWQDNYNSERIARLEGELEGIKSANVGIAYTEPEEKPASSNGKTNSTGVKKMLKPKTGAETGGENEEAETIDHSEAIAAKEREIENLKKENERLKNETKSIEARTKNLEKRTLTAEYKEWLNSEAVAARIEPLEYNEILEQLLEYSEDDSEVTYSEVDGEEKKGTKVDRMKARIMKRGILPTRNEVAVDGKAKDKLPAPLDFGEGNEVDTASHLRKVAIDKIAAEKNITYAEARLEWKRQNEGA